MLLNLEPNDEDKIGYVSMKHTRTEADGGNDTEHMRKKRAKKNDSETEADSEDSCFVALVTASNLQKDALYLPKDFSNSNGLEKECREIIVTDGWERAWTVDLRFNESSDSFYISRGWRSLCDENGKKAGGLFVFKLMTRGETPLLTFCPTESRGERPSKKESYPAEPCNGKRINKEKMESYLRCGDSTQPSQNRFVTLTFTRETELNGRQCLPWSFQKENGLDKPGMITLLGKDGTKRLVNLRWKAANNLCLGKGWKEFARENGLKIGKSFTLESIWENGTPRLRLVDTGSTSSRSQQGEYCSKARSEKQQELSEKNTGQVKNSREEMRESSSAILNRFATLTLTLEDVRDCKLVLPSQFMKANGINKLGKVTLLGKNKMKYFAYLLSKDGMVALGCDWKGFCEANGVKIGASFTLEFISEQDTTCLFEFRPNSREEV